MRSVYLPIPSFVSYYIFILVFTVWLVNEYFDITGVIASPTSSTVELSDDVTLTCTPRSPLVSPRGYSWHRVDGNLPSGSSGQDTDRLTLHNVVLADEGQYFCMATLFRHCAISDNVMVIVKGIKMIS